MNPETMLDTVGKECEAATKFQEIIQKVFGSGWKKQADADERNPQTIRANPDMEIVYTKDGMNARMRTLEAFAYRAEQRLLNDAIREQENLECVFEATAHEIEEVSSTNDAKVDDDWLVRFINISKDITTEEMQKIWGKILAGEIEQPGSFSLRTLETIRNISRNEALVFNKIVPYLFNMGKTVLMTSSSDIYKKYGIKYDDILVLDECGLINSSGTLSITATSSGESDLLLYNEATALIVHGSETKPLEFAFGIHSLTEPGRQLYRILNHIPNHEYFEEVANNISQNAGEPVYLHKVNYITGDRINYEDDPYKVLGNSQ